MNKLIVSPVLITPIEGYLYIGSIEVSKNTIENFWSILKRGIYGIYHQVSDKHVSRYLDEFAARFNTRELSAQERFDGFLEDAESVLTYNRLTLD